MNTDFTNLVSMDEGILVSNSFISNVEVPEDESMHSTEIVLLKIKS